MCKLCVLAITNFLKIYFTDNWPVKLLIIEENILGETGYGKYHSALYHYIDFKIIWIRKVV